MNAKLIPPRPRRTTTDEIQTFKSSIPFWRQLRWNLIVYFVALAVIPLTIVLLITLTRMSEQAREQASRQLESVAALRKSQITEWLKSSQAVLHIFLADATKNDRFEFFAAASSQPSGSLTNQEEQEALNTLLKAAVEAQTFFEEMFLYNRAGQIVVASDPNRIGQVVTNQPYFATSLQSEEDFVQPPFYELGRTDLTMIVTHPLSHTMSSQPVAVLAGRLNMSTLGQIMTQWEGLGASGETYLVSPDNNYLITPSRFEEQGYTRTRAYHSQGIEQALRGTNGSAIYSNYRVPAVPVIGVYRWLPELQAGLLAEIDETEALADFEQARNFSIGLALGTALLAAFFGLYYATRVTKPITALIQAARRVSAGKLDISLPAPGQDEVGLLSSVFMNMAGQLRDMLTSLEQRVADRTRDLETSAAISRSLSTILDQKQLMRAVVEQVRSAFNYYYAHIYLFDETGQNLVMVGGTGAAGQTMLAQGHMIPRDKGLVGRAAETNRMVLIPDVSQEPDWLPNPLLPDTRAEIAVPIAIGKRVLGVFDVQHNLIGGLTQAEAELLQAIANQVAIALQNAHLYAQVKKQVEHETRVNAIGQKIRQATTIEEVLQTTVRELAESLGAKQANIQLNRVVQAANGEDAPGEHL